MSFLRPRRRVYVAAPTSAIVEIWPFELGRNHDGVEFGGEVLELPATTAPEALPVLTHHRAAIRAPRLHDPEVFHARQHMSVDRGIVLGVPTPPERLAFEAAHPRRTPDRDSRIQTELGVTPIRYVVLLDRAAVSAEGIAADPFTARRVRERAERATRRRQSRFAS